MIAAALLPLLFANRKVFVITAALTGIGIGLFIDEVGKYITSDNNYFYPPAAPIIYGFFLLLVVLYSLNRQKPSGNDRAEMYHALDLMEEVLDEDLDADEKKEIETTLEHVLITSHRPEYRGLAAELLHFIAAQDARKGLRSSRLPAWITSLSSFFDKRIPVIILRISSIISLVSIGAFMSVYPVRIALASSDWFRLSALLQPLLEQGLLTSSPEQVFMAVRLMLEVFAGMLFFISGLLMIFRKGISAGGRLAYFAFLLSFTVIDLLIFYYDQFSTIFFVTIQLFVFLLVQTYRRRMKQLSGE